LHLTHNLDAVGDLGALTCVDVHSTGMIILSDVPVKTGVGHPLKAVP